MPIRVLATFPEVPRDVAVFRDQPGSSPSTARAEARDPAAAAPADAAGPLPLPALSPAARPPRRIRPRASFPGASVAALAVVAAAIWSLIAIREVRRPAAAERGVRIAAETAAAGAAEATLR
jgi:hypothetical protein